MPRKSLTIHKGNILVFIIPYILRIIINILPNPVLSGFWGITGVTAAVN